MRVFGDKPKFRAQPGRNTMKKRTGPSPQRLEAVSRLLKGLNKPRTTEELTSVLGLTLRGVRYSLKQARELGMVRVCEWRENSPGHPTAVYCAGGGMDVPKPSALRADQAHERRIAKQRARRLASKAAKRDPFAIPKRDPITAALFGAV